MNKTLFKQNKNGTIESWNIQVVDNQIIATWGKLDGKMQVKTETIETGKNIGKANETTPAEQALFQAKSILNKKLDKGYSETIEGAKENKLDIKPVLVQNYTLGKNSDKIKFPCYVQPKLDGVRSQLFLKDVLIAKSRGNKEFPANKQLFSQIEEFMKLNNLEVIDGEFYVHGEYLEDIISCVKKPTKNRLEDLISFHLFDLPLNRGFDSFKNLNTTNFSKINLVETTLVNSKEEARVLLDKYVSLGYEGLILRNIKTYDDAYPTGGIRSDEIQKWKEFVDSEFKVVDVISDKNGNGVYVCETELGKKFNVTPKCTHDKKREILENKELYIGKDLTVRYQDLTEDGIPRFGRGIAIRDYE